MSGIIYIALNSKKENLQNLEKLINTQSKQYNHFEKLEKVIKDDEELKLHMKAKKNLGLEIKDLKKYKKEIEEPEYRMSAENPKDLDILVKLKITPDNTSNEWIKELNYDDQDKILSKLEKYENYQKVNLIYIKEMNKFHSLDKKNEKENVQELVR